jgi:hypothetical protein
LHRFARNDELWPSRQQKGPDIVIRPFILSLLQMSHAAFSKPSIFSAA